MFFATQVYYRKAKQMLLSLPLKFASRATDFGYEGELNCAMCSASWETQLRLAQCTDI